jgi:DNA topoisomerase-1
VLWHKKIKLSPVVRRNLAELLRAAQASNPTREKSRIFEISSSDVNAYLSEVLPGLTAKVFRTHHATEAVRDRLLASEVEASDPEHQKWEAVSLANLEAAILCNHYKTAPARWQESRQRASERLEKRKERVAHYRRQVREAKDAPPALRREGREKEKEARTEKQRDRVQVRYAKKIERAKKKIETAENRLRRAELALDKAETKEAVAVKKRTWNLGTSLKSYIDPRVFCEWGEQVDYDVLERYYPQALRRKFAWARGEERKEN